MTETARPDDVKRLQEEVVQLRARLEAAVRKSGPALLLVLGCGLVAAWLIAA